THATSSAVGSPSTPTPRTALSPRSRGGSGRASSPPPRGSRASSTPTWRRGSRSSRCAAGWTRAASRSWHSAAPRGCTSPKSPALMTEIADRFHTQHEALYAYSAAGQEVVIVNARVAVVGELPVLPAQTAAASGHATVGPTRRRVWLGDWIEVPVYRMDALPAGHEVKGPAVFESAATTVLVREGERVTITSHGWLDIRIG